MFAFDDFTLKLYAEIDTVYSREDQSAVGEVLPFGNQRPSQCSPSFMYGFANVPSMDSLGDHPDSVLLEASAWLGPESAAHECQAMEGVDSTALIYGESDLVPLENCFWREPVYAAGKCQAMPGSDGDSGTRLESYTVGTRTGAGVRKVVLNLPVLQEKASRKLTLKKAAHKFGMCPTALKTSLRRLGIENWREFHSKP